MSSPDDPTTLPVPAAASLAFTPVPRLKDRSNGWKPHVQRAFIEALAETGSVRAACRRVGRSEHGVYQMRRHPEAAEFNAAWDAALEFGVRRIEDGAMDRAINGTEERIYYHGQHVATRHRFNERLVMFILRNRAPDRFAQGGGARGLSGLDQATLKKLKKQWHEEWLRERIALEQEEEDETLESIDAFIEDIRVRREQNMSPRARAAFAEAERIRQEDLDGAWKLEEIEAGEDAEPDPLLALPAPEAGGGLGEDGGGTGEDAPEVPRVRSLKDDGW